MRYMLMIYADESAFATLSQEQLTQTMQEFEKYSTWLREKGWLREGDQLADSDKATTVRGAGGEILTVDGPYAETKEQLGGYYILECDHLDDAIEAAKRVPSVAAGGSVEVRPIIDM